MNPELVQSILVATNLNDITSNGSEFSIKQKVTVSGVGDVSFSDHGVKNLLCMTKLVNQGFRIGMNTDIQRATKVFTPQSTMLTFERRVNGLYFHNFKNQQVVMLYSQYENRFKIHHKTKRKRKTGAKFYQMLGYHSLKYFKAAIKYNLFQDCPI